METLEMEKKNWENLLGFADNGVWSTCGNLTVLWREVMWSAVNLLPNSPKISQLTKRHVF